MQLKTSVLLLPLLNPVEVAENLATLDHLTRGRLVVGVAVGYREAELQTVGLTRKDRGPKLEESIQLMKQLWTGEEVTFQGRYVTVEHGRMGFVPYQKPHPPLEMGAQSEAATRRAARLVNAVFFGPQVAWKDIGILADVYREQRPIGGEVGASRCLMLGSSKEDAATRAAQYLQKTFAMYKNWRMQETGMVPLQLDSGISLDDWTVHGSPADCIEAIERGRELYGLEGIGLTIYSLPRAPEERIEYLQRIADEIVKPIKARAGRAKRAPV